jgi:hypothetical protein
VSITMTTMFGGSSIRTRAGPGGTAAPSSAT